MMSEIINQIVNVGHIITSEVANQVVNDNNNNNDGRDDNAVHNRAKQKNLQC